MFTLTSDHDVSILLTGIDTMTGSLEVTASATSVVGGQQYKCTCGDESKCYDIHSEFNLSN